MVEQLLLCQSVEEDSSKEEHAIGAHGIVQAGWHAKDHGAKGQQSEYARTVDELERGRHENNADGIGAKGGKDRDEDDGGHDEDMRIGKGKGKEKAQASNLEASSGGSAVKSGRVRYRDEWGHVRYRISRKARAAALAGKQGLAEQAKLLNMLQRVQPVPMPHEDAQQFDQWMVLDDGEGGAPEQGGQEKAVQAAQSSSTAAQGTKRRKCVAFAPPPPTASR
jgi:hypothetical protein